MHSTLISVAQLQRLLATDAPPRVFDCSWDLGQPLLGGHMFDEAHLPGASHVNLETDLSDLSNPAHPPSNGRHPLPTRQQFAQWMGQQGIEPHTQVVVYDRQGQLFAARLWWMLKWCGHEAVAVLDGGWRAWTECQGPQTTSADQSERKTVAPGAAYPLRDPLVTALSTHDVAAHLGRPTQTVVDARAPARFRGELEPLDPVAGHIPGALNRPFGDNFEPSGLFKQPDVLRQEWERLLARKDPATVVHQCGSGVSALPNLLAMELAGLGRTRLYAGSWSAWCNTPGLPMAHSAVVPASSNL